MLFFSLCIRRHSMSVCPMTGNVNLNHCKFNIFFLLYNSSLSGGIFWDCENVLFSNKFLPAGSAFILTIWINYYYNDCHQMVTNVLISLHSLVEILLQRRTFCHPTDGKSHQANSPLTGRPWCCLLRGKWKEHQSSHRCGFGPPFEYSRVAMTSWKISSSTRLEGSCSFFTTTTTIIW